MLRYIFGVAVAIPKDAASPLNATSASSIKKCIFVVVERILIIMIHTALISAPFGMLFIEASSSGVTQIRIAEVLDQSTNSSSVFIEQAIEQLQEYFAGQRKIFELSLDPIGTDFQQRVWAELQKIPHGKTLSYLEMAQRLGNVKAIRAAASANGKNPLLIVIPCHRVIGKDGALVGFSSGLAVKKWLLDHESEFKQQSLF